MKIKVVSALDSDYWTNRFKEYQQYIVKNYSSQKVNKIENYTSRRFPLDRLHGLFLMLDQDCDKIAAFVSVFTPQVWPKEVARIGNRTWVDPEYRAKGLSLKDKAGNCSGRGRGWGVSFAYEAQVQCCKGNGIKLALMTRENTPLPYSGNAMAHAYEGLRRVRPNWKFDPDYYYLTCPCESAYSCWQKIVYCELEKGAEEFLNSMKKITNEAYDERFAKS